MMYNEVYIVYDNQDTIFHIDPLLHTTVRCAGLNFSELAETMKRRVTAVTLLPNVPHTMTGFIIFARQGGMRMKETERNYVFSPSCFCNDDLMIKEVIFLQDYRCSQR